MLFYGIWRGLKHYMRKKGLEDQESKGKNKVKPRSSNIEIITIKLTKKKKSEDKPKIWNIKVEDIHE